MQPEQIAKKIRTILLDQKSRLEEYLGVLEHEQDDLLKQDPDKLIEHIGIEKNIVSELSSLNKILEPLEVMYNESPYKKDENLFEIKNKINLLTNKVKIKANINKEKLEIIIDNVKTELKNIKKAAIPQPVYTSAQPGLVDISG